MSKINQIQQAILSLGGGAYQKLMEAYLVKRYKYENIMPLGSHAGTNKTTKGVPDSFVKCANQKFILIAYGTVENHSFNKVKADIQACLNTKKTKINVEEIEQIICCHTSTNLTIAQIKKLSALFPNILLIGLAEVSYDLLFKYQSLALDHLGIGIDTHQIFDIDDFIKEEAKNLYSTTLDMPLLCRETELNDVVQALDSESVILIFGASGIGKTRLALQAARQYAQRTNAIIKVIKSNDESIYEDLKSTFSDENLFVVVVDDANQLAQLDLLLSLFFDSPETNKIKLILTVRDYAKTKIQQITQGKYRTFEYQLSQLSDDSIDDILSENLGLGNENLRKQIQLIAKGNVRLAVMAGSCALQGNITKVRNAFDIFDDYYSSIIAEMDRGELLVASIVALFESFKLEESIAPLQLAYRQGINRDVFVEYCYSLHKKEVVDVYEDKAVRFENQNLRDYLIYHVFFKSKMLAPSDVIIAAFPQYRNRIVFVFTTLVQLFNSEENYAHIEKEIRKAWEVMKRSPVDTVEKFIKSFLEILPDEALLYTKKQIDQLPVVQNNLIHYNFQEARQLHNAQSSIMSFLASFKNTELFRDAIQLAIYYFEKNNEYPMEFYSLFGDAWGFTHISYRDDFGSENILFDEVYENFEKKKTLPSAQCLYFVVLHCLKLEFSSTEAKSAREISHITFRLPACESILALRKKCIRATSELLSVPEYAEYAHAILSSSFKCKEKGRNIEILREDVLALVEYIAPILTANNFEHCLLLERIEKICRQSDIPYPSSFENCNSNQVYEVYRSMNVEDYFFKVRDYDLAEVKRQKALEEISDRTSEECFNSLWNELKKIVAQGRTIPWWVITGVEIVFDNLKNTPEKFISCVETYMYQKMPDYIREQAIVDIMVKLCGIAEAVRMVSRFQFKAQSQWLAKIYNHLKADEVTEEIKHKLLSLKEMPLEERCPVSFETVIRVAERFPGFVVEYIEMLNEVAEEQPALMTRFLSSLAREEKEYIVSIMPFFSDQMSVLQTAYKHAVRGREFFDHSGSLFEILIDNDAHFISDVVDQLADDQSETMNNVLLDVLWKRSDYLTSVSIAIETLRKHISDPYYAEKSVEYLIGEKSGESDINNRRKEWIEGYILENSRDAERMSFLFGVIRDCPQDQFSNALLYFCKCNSDYLCFCEIPLESTFLSWSGSEVPVIEQQIAFLEDLRDKLKGIQYIEHRNRLGQCIYWKQERKQKVLMEEFLAKEN